MTTTLTPTDQGVCERCGAPATWLCKQRRGRRTKTTKACGKHALELSGLQKSKVGITEVA
jgi:hypothetical protein